MPTKRFTNMQQVGPIAAEVDGNGDVLFPSSSGGGSTQVEGTQPHFSETQPNPIVIGYIGDDGTVRQFQDGFSQGAPAIYVVNEAFRVNHDLTQLTSASATLAVAGTPQEILAQSFTRRVLILGNPNAVAKVWYRFGGAASSTGENSFLLLPGDTIIFPRSNCPAGAISAVSDTNGAFITAEWAA